MPRRDLQSFWGLLADLFRELPWLFRLCFFGGLGLGLALGLYLTSQVPAAERRYGLTRALVFFVLGLGALGAFLGLAVGSVAELVWSRLRKPGPPGGKKKRPGPPSTRR